MKLPHRKSGGEEAGKKQVAFDSEDIMLFRYRWSCSLIHQSIQARLVTFRGHTKGQVMPPHQRAEQ